MNKQLAAHYRYELADELLRGKWMHCYETGIDIDLGVVVDAEADRGPEFADEAADALVYRKDGASMESDYDYAMRVRDWLLKLCAKHITDAMVEEHADKLDEDRDIEERIQDKREAA